MSGTQNGGRKAAIKNKLYNPNFYKINGRKGGLISRGGGFGSTKVGPDGLTGPERARTAGAVGGMISVRKPKERKFATEAYIPSRFSVRETLTNLFKL